MKGLGPHAPLVSKGKPPPLLAVVDALPCSSFFSRTIIFSPLSDIMPELYIVRCRQKSRLSLVHGTIRAHASNVGVGPGDYGSNSEKDSQNVFEKNSINDSSSKT
ncbi:hypothetical protein SESBI_28605 [Sesbania bispinosa]|nr:hypothetical protein SESBI_28605 [Sesbania bispinosa]